MCRTTSICNVLVCHSRVSHAVELAFLCILYVIEYVLVHHWHSGRRATLPGVGLYRFTAMSLLEVSFRLHGESAHACMHNLQKLPMSHDCLHVCLPLQIATCSHNAAQEVVMQKHKLCKKWEQDQKSPFCAQGANCPFAHGPEKQKTPRGFAEKKKEQEELSVIGKGCFRQALISPPWKGCRFRPFVMAGVVGGGLVASIFLRAKTSVFTAFLLLMLAKSVDFSCFSVLDGKRRFFFVAAFSFFLGGAGRATSNLGIFRRFTYFSIRFLMHFLLGQRAGVPRNPR